MNIQDVYGIMDRFQQSAMTEIQLKFEGLELICKKDNSDCVIKNQSNNFQAKVENTETISDENNNNLNEENIIEIRTKVAGTFYRAASPESEPFVQVGQRINKGDVVGMIEAMKMMNEITSPVNGIVTEICLKNEEITGYDSVIMKIAE